MRMAVRTDEGPPRRDKRLTRELLDEIVRATGTGQSLRLIEMATRPGWTREQVWRELSELRDDGLLRAKNEPRDLSDHPDDPSLLIEGLTDAGWTRYDELRRPIRSWLTRHSALITTFATVAGVVVAALALIWG